MRVVGRSGRRTDMAEFPPSKIKRKIKRKVAQFFLLQLTFLFFLLEKDTNEDWNIYLPTVVSLSSKHLHL